MVFNKTITSFFSDQTIFEESSLQFDHELDEWSNANETLQISFDYAKIRRKAHWAILEDIIKWLRKLCPKYKY